MFRAKPLQGSVRVEPPQGAAFGEYKMLDAGI